MASLVAQKMSNSSYMGGASTGNVTPRVIIHGGAGRISRSNLPAESYALYRESLLAYVRSTERLLRDGVSALDAATHAVTSLEDDPLFNCGRGAVFTCDGTMELEASVMVSRGFVKRCAGVSLLKGVRNPIRLAREILVRGGRDGGEKGEGSAGDEMGNGQKKAADAQAHVFLAGQTAKELAQSWGLEMVDEKWHWTRKRWEEHRRGLEEASGPEEEAPWTAEEMAEWAQEDHDVGEYLPQGTVGAVCLDRDGIMCVATSTGGLTNKLPGRIGDTPTPGAGFWAEEWDALPASPGLPMGYGVQRALAPPIVQMMPTAVRDSLLACLPEIVSQSLGLSPVSSGLSTPAEKNGEMQDSSSSGGGKHAIAMSGTGNGDSFLRLACVRTTGAITRFSTFPHRTLQSAVTQMVGPGGEMQRSAGERWGKTFEGEGGTIGSEFKDGVGKIAFDFNCGGMFRTWVDDHGTARVMVFKDDF